MARDKYLMYLRQQEYKKQPEGDKETLELWNNQPAIHFDLGENK